MNEVGIYKSYRLGRLSNTTFDRTIKILERDLHPLHHDYADKINAQSNINGLLYELDEKATKLYWDKKPYKNIKEFTSFEEVDTTDVKIDDLRFEYKELSKEEPKMNWGVKRLTEEIEKLKK